MVEALDAKIKSVGLTASGSLRSRSVGPRRTDIHVRNGALAASLRLGPLRETSVQPAPKSRLAVSERFAYEDQKQIKGFPAEAGPTL
ncbi:hypothetical protein AO263_20765 [Pseudomonas sp. NZIPFR-PS5]|nr:hypothetical protein AO263_20765 [Pseudomonas sp. NZIPFR-PS5]